MIRRWLVHTLALTLALWAGTVVAFMILVLGVLPATGTREGSPWGLFLATDGPFLAGGVLAAASAAWGATGGRRHGAAWMLLAGLLFPFPTGLVLMAQGALAGYLLAYGLALVTGALWVAVVVLCGYAGWALFPRHHRALAEDTPPR